MASKKPATGKVAIKPSPHYFLPGVPHVEQEVPADVAAEYVKSGAFTYADEIEAVVESPDAPDSESAAQ